MVLKYIRGNRLDVAAIGDVVPESTRTALLRWISAAGMTASKTGRTEYGKIKSCMRLPRRACICAKGSLMSSWDGA